MKTITIKELKAELNNCSNNEIIELCLLLSKFKKENKELLTYLLVESSNEEGYINNIKTEINEQFDLINTKTYYFIKKSVRKILRLIKKYIRYSKSKETEIELLIYFCKKLYEFKPSIKKNNALQNICIREMEAIRKKMTLLHEDLQYDYELELQKLIF